MLNQSRGHWLLFDALVTTINLILAMEFQPNPSIDGSETCDQFDVEFHMLNKNMWQEVVKVTRPFLQFLKVFDSCHVHNMLALMLDPRYKSLQVFENCVGCGNAIHIACEYDMKVNFQMLASLPNKFLGF
jgi:hypothetical protein